MLLDQKAVQIIGLAELNGVTQLSDPHTPSDYEHKQDNWFLVDSNQTAPEAFSAFLEANRRHGIRLFDQLANQAAFQGVIDRTPTIIRALRNYQRQQWDYFDSSVGELLGERPGDDARRRLDAVLQILDNVYRPVMDNDQDVQLISSFIELVDQIENANDDGFLAFMTTIEPHLEAARREAIDLTLRWLPHCSEFRPLVAERDPARPNQPVQSQLKMASAECIHHIKSLYVDGYELICRGLTVVSGLINLSERGDYNSYPAHPHRNFKRFRPVDLAEFHESAHAPKIGLVTHHSLFRVWLDSALDSALRNSIGHNAIDFDPQLHSLTYSQGRRVNTPVTISYASFLARIIHVLVCAHQLNWFCSLADCPNAGMTTILGWSRPCWQTR